MTEEKIEVVDLEKVKSVVYQGNLVVDMGQLVEAGLITEQGLRIQGIGMIVRKLDRLIERVDAANKKLFFVEKAIRGEGKSKIETYK